jgi:hypothetical protein
MPIDKPALDLDALNVVMEPRNTKRLWDKPVLPQQLEQLAKLKFTHITLPKTPPAIEPIKIDGDTGGRKAFGGAKVFPGPAPAPDMAKLAAAHGLEVEYVQMPALSVLPTADEATAHLISRQAYEEITPEKALSDLVTPICGEGVAERLQKGFALLEQANALVQKNAPSLGLANQGMLDARLKSKAPEPWLTEAKTLYAGAMNEMYRANTRAREGARSLTLYHAKRLEFTFHFFTALESIKPDTLELAAESFYNALNSYADAARDDQDRLGIALLNEYAYKPLLQALSD